ncbi:MAG TPA: crossover junction endodeoxyribonuclease RuvC [Acidobacteriaceae bacterium]|jgi:crossover junction endodeoxyribonuclease RuvC|nr:crossover junction endodeoxyribonuclease RuvC [Acidobacteriaceae bacterium]
MRVLGIDCGTQFTGYGVVESEAAGPLRAITSGAIRLVKRDPLPQRLCMVFAELQTLMAQHQPDVVAIEEVFHAANSRTALLLGQVRGVALLAAATSKLEIAEYAPLAVKSAVSGYGLADKQQVQFMVMRLLELTVAPEPMDASDALAIAICHIHHAQTMAAQQRIPEGRRGTR